MTAIAPNSSSRTLVVALLYHICAVAMCIFTPNMVAVELPLALCSHLIALKAICSVLVFSVVSNRRISTAKVGLMFTICQWNNTDLTLYRNKIEVTYSKLVAVAELSSLWRQKRTEIHVLALLYTINSEIFARVLFSRNFAYAKFRENKPSRIGEITLSFTDIGKSRPCRAFLT